MLPCSKDWFGDSEWPDSYSDSKLLDPDGSNWFQLLYPAGLHSARHLPLCALQRVSNKKHTIFPSTSVYYVDGIAYDRKACRSNKPPFLERESESFDLATGSIQTMHEIVFCFVLFSMQ